MSHWTAWDWIAYGCLGIAAFGLAVGAVWKENPALFEAWPAFFANSKWSFVPAGLFIIGTAILLFRAFFIPGETARQPSVATQQMASSVYGFFQFSDSHSIPVEKKTTNVLSWYALFTESIYVDAKDVQNKSVG